MYFVFDIGGTNTRMAISWNGVTIVDEKIIPTEENFEDGLVKMEQVIKEYSKKEPVTSAAGGIAGVLDTKKNKLLKSPNLRGWEDKPVGTRLEKMMGAKLILENDAVMGGLGEARVGAGRRRSIVGFLTIGTGVGGCKFVDGEPDARAFGFEPGHQIISVGGQIKYLEEFISGVAMEKVYGKPAVEIDDPEAWEKEAQLLAIGIHNATVLWSPEMMVLGGALMNKISLKRVSEIAKEQMDMFPKIPEIVIGELGDKAGLMGALVRLGKRE